MEILYEMKYLLAERYYEHRIEYRVNGFKHVLTIYNVHGKYTDKEIYKIVYDEIKKSNKVVYVRRY